jgi:hypothetical protein
MWLGISCALLIWAVPFVKKQGIARSRLIAAMALICVLCLLFPVISMTDDLHNTPAVVESKELRKLVIANHAFTALLWWFSLQVLFKPVAVPAENQEKQSLPTLRIFTVDLGRRPPPFAAHLFV